MKIVAIGTGKKDEPIDVKVGDQVLYGKYSGTEVTIGGKEYLITKESDRNHLINYSRVKF